MVLDCSKGGNRETEKRGTKNQIAEVENSSNIDGPLFPSPAFSVDPYDTSPYLIHLKNHSFLTMANTTRVLDWLVYETGGALKTQDWKTWDQISWWKTLVIVMVPRFSVPRFPSTRTTFLQIWHISQYSNHRFFTMAIISTSMLDWSFRNTLEIEALYGFTVKTDKLFERCIVKLFRNVGQKLISCAPW